MSKVFFKKKMLLLFLIISFMAVSINRLSVDNRLVVGDEKPKISLDKNYLSLNVGDKYKINAELSGSNDKITWISSNKKFATVDDDGNVLAISPGTVFIFAVLKSDSSVRAICKISININSDNSDNSDNSGNNDDNDDNDSSSDTTQSSTTSDISVTKVELSKSSMVVKVGTSGKLSVNVLPTNATNKNLKWASSNSSVLSVDTSGNIKALKAGVATITVSSIASPNVKDTCVITVKNEIVNVKSIKFSDNLKVLKYGETYKLKPVVSPSNATDTKLIYSSSDPDYVSVDQNGLVKVKMNKNGYAAIAVRSSSNDSVKAVMYISTRGKLKKLGTQKSLGNITTVKGVKGGPHVAQGFCVAHVGDDIYLLAAHRDSSEKKVLIRVFKRISKNGDVSIKEINSFTKGDRTFEHANGLTCDVKNNTVYVVGIKNNSAFKYFGFKDSLNKNVTVHSGAFKSSDNDNVYVGAIAYDEYKNKYYVGAGGKLRVTDSNKKVLKSIVKDGVTYTSALTASIDANNRIGLQITGTLIPSGSAMVINVNTTIQ